MREYKRVAISSLQPDPEQPRKHFDESDLFALGQNMKQHGQQVPLIVFGSTILDGERRWRAAQVVGISELDVVALSSRPTPTGLRLLQMSIDAHRTGLSPIERSDFLVKIKEENNWSVTELAAHLCLKQPLVTKLLAYAKLAPDIRELLHAGAIDMEKAYVISQEPDHARQRQLLKMAQSSTREQLRRKIRSPDAVEVKTNVARFVMPGGTAISLQGRELTLTVAVEVLTEAVRTLKKGLSQGLDITTQQRVMRDTAKVSHV
jgi:ParB family chromosome partitioning protein